MRIKMTNRACKGVANVLPEDVAKWEAAGWVAEQKKTSRKKDIEE